LALIGFNRKQARLRHLLSLLPFSNWFTYGFCKLHANMHDPSDPSNALKTQLFHQDADSKG
jgi:hypothetical protein